MKVAASALTRFSQAEVRHLYRHSKVILSKPALRIAQAPKDPAHDFSRVLIVIPKKVGSAVIRNKIRRRIKNLFFQLQLYQGNFDYIIRVNPEGAHLSFIALKKILESLNNRKHSE